MLDLRKGQNLALESAATFGLTLIAAIGVIHSFNTVNEEVVGSTQVVQSEVVSDRLKIALVQMSYLSDNERGFVELELPEELGNQKYKLAAGNSSLKTIVGSRRLESEYNIVRPSETVRGAVGGASVRLFKSEEGYNLREGR